MATQEHLTMSVMLAGAGHNIEVARLTELDGGGNDVEVEAMPDELTGIVAMHLESTTRAVRQQLSRGFDQDSLPGLDFDEQYRPYATARQVLAVAERLACIQVALTCGERLKPGEAYDSLTDGQRRVLAATASMLLTAAREAGD